MQGEDLEFAYDSISAFSSSRDNQEAVFGAEEGLKDIRYDSLPAYTGFGMLLGYCVLILNWMF